MQLKRFPADFRVRELIDLPEDARDGEFYVHLVRKEKLDTLEAISQVARAAGVDRADIAFAGLKDRQGITEQYITVRGQSVRIDERNLRVRPVGRLDRAITSKASRGNAFEIVVRDLDRSDVERLERRIDEIVESGFANYFDDQRFNCLKHGQGFIMKEVLDGRYEQALRQLLAQPSRVALGGDVKLKRLLDEHWGDWQRCSRIARGPIFKRVFGHLDRNSRDFRGALEAVPTRIKLIHAFAYQSHLWNRALSRHIERLLDPKRCTAIETEAGRNVGWWALPRSLRDRFRKEDTPLYGPEGAGGSAAFRSAMERTLSEARLAPEAFLVHRVSGMLLKEEPRIALIMPRGLASPRVEADESNRGRRKATLEFELPRGSYATMLLKNVWAYPWRTGRERVRTQRRTPSAAVRNQQRDDRQHSNQRNIT